MCYTPTSSGAVKAQRGEEASRFSGTLPLRSERGCRWGEEPTAAAPPLPPILPLPFCLTGTKLNSFFSLQTSCANHLISCDYFFHSPLYSSLCLYLSPYLSIKRGLQFLQSSIISGGRDLGNFLCSFLYFGIVLVLYDVHALCVCVFSVWGLSPGVLSH